jgi:hypothetical protein
MTFPDQSPMSVYIMCSACIQTSESIPCDSKDPVPVVRVGVYRSRRCCVLNNAVILYISFYIFYNFNIFQYLNICTSQIDVFMLVLLYV